MEKLLENLAICVARGKATRDTPYPADMNGKDGASEITRELLDAGVSPNDILQKAMIIGMHKIGEDFARGKAFIPEILIAAKAMNAAMEHLKPFFETGEAVYKGTVILGTVAGDLHDIGKKIVRMVLEGDGWKIVDLGVDVQVNKFLDAINQNPGCIVGMSALLTTTMSNMEQFVKQIKKEIPDINIFLGGAPLSQEFSNRIGADGYFPEPHSFAKHLKAIKN
ncbi:MAG: cobalamin-dependent protein [Candidatus Electryonea clarkiae]|nr:cobalamin-dependent protein [Candidatus Electryonea clarkiae]MDP8286747.1 cobalamin-dependent protein [Candidatus Electryonea clarkiae]